MSQWKKILLLIVLVMVVDHVCSQGCSQCKMIAEQGSGGGVDESTFGRNINYGILYLMIIPYVLLMFFFRKRIRGLFRALTNKK